MKTHTHSCIDTVVVLGSNQPKVAMLCIHFQQCDSTSANYIILKVLHRIINTSLQNTIKYIFQKISNLCSRKKLILFSESIHLIQFELKNAAILLLSRAKYLVVSFCSSLFVNISYILILIFSRIVQKTLKVFTPQILL